jgi:hypothetical protein
MSILDALRVQKANQRSIADLAVLPQNEIIRLAQMGHIPADVVPVVINEKARMAKDAANLQAASQVQGGMPTVIEQAMQQNAAAEAPAAGVSGLPTGDMFQEQSYQSGGIVAFNGENDSWVQSNTGLRVLESEADPEAAAGLGLGKYVRQYQAMTAPYRGVSPEEEAYLADLKKGSLSPKDMEQQKWMRMLQAGLGIMGGKSPYALANIAEGSKEALQGYASDIKAQKEQQRGELKTAAELARAKRLENIADIAGGAELQKAAMDRDLRMQIAKDSQLGAKYADNYLLMRKQAGDKRPDEVLRDEGYRQFFKEYGYASGRAATQASIAQGQQQTQRDTNAATQTTATAAQDLQARTAAIKEWGDLKMSDPAKREYNKLYKTNQADAEKMKEDWIKKTIERARPSATQKPPADGAAPRPAPAASGAAPAPKKGDTRKIASGPYAGKTAVFDGTGWVPQQ